MSLSYFCISYFHKWFNLTLWSAGFVEKSHMKVAVLQHHDKFMIWMNSDYPVLFNNKGIGCAQ